MKNREALSQELNRVVDCYEAYDLYFVGEIKDARKFECSQVGCSARATLSSVDNREERKQVPHFRFYDHKPGCPNDSKNAGVDTEETDEDSLENRTFGSGIDILETKRRKRAVTTAGGNQLSGYDPDDTKRKHKANKPRSGKRDRKYYTIKILVKNYEAYKKDGLLAKRFLMLNQKKTSYFMSFVELENGRVVYPKVERIYIGMAQIVKNSKNDYVVRFENEVIAEGESYKPSAYISKKIIDESYRNNKWEEELDELAQTGESIKIYMCGSARIYNGEGKKYLNIMITQGRLDFVEML